MQIVESQMTLVNQTHATTRKRKRLQKTAHTPHLYSYLVKGLRAKLQKLVMGFNGDDEAATWMELPTGFRFHPTDEELITHYLSHKFADSSFSCSAIGEVDLNRVEPWDLPWKAKMGEKEWYFFCIRDRKYPTGLRTNRATDAGYWKATGKDKEIFRGCRILIGMKKTLVFYRGRAPRGEKTNWVMHEYRLDSRHGQSIISPVKNEWVICRVFKKGLGGKKVPIPGQLRSADSRTDELLSADRNLVSNGRRPSCMDSVLMQADFLQGMSSAMIMSCQDMGVDQEFPVVPTAQVDLDCLWDY